MRIRKGLASRFWEKLVIAIIGDQFDVGTWWCWELLCDRPTLVITFADIMNVYLGVGSE